MATTAPETTQAGWLDPFLADWRPGTGEPHENREPATRPAAADPRPVHARTTSPRPPRPRRPPSPPGPRRATPSGPAILRRAAEIYEAHRPEFGTWTQRETGAVHGKMHHEQNFAAGELNAAATMPFQPYGQLVPSVVPGRLSMLRRVPAGVIGAITPWNSPSVLGMRIVAPALAARQRRDPQARPADAGQRRRDVRGGVPRGRPARRPAPRRPRRRRDRRGDRHRPQRQPGVLHGLHRRGPPGRRRSPGERLKRVEPRARRQQRVRRARRRGPRGRGLGRRLRLVPVPGPGLLRDRAPHRPSQHRRRLRRPAGREGRSGSGSATRTARRSTSARSSTRSSSRGSTASSGARSTRARGSSSAATHEGLFYRPTVLTDVTTDHAAWREEIFGPVAPVVVFDTDEEALALANDSEYGLAGAVYSRSISRGLALAQQFRSPGWST